MGVNLEIKGPADPRLVAAEVAQDLDGREGPFVVSSFWPPIVEDPAVSGETVALARAAGVGIVPWTVDDPSRLRELAGFGVTGLITNEPDVAGSALAG
ncbi:MAG: hypothetical protein KY429_03840 [Actinobacteria bacterium]|nr:hypothetical protein [Actinomycetota bacterium]